MALNISQVVTDRIVAALESGVAPWRKPWQTAQGSRFAMNLMSRKEYRGVNQLMLSMSGYVSPFWLTYKQAAELGGNVRKGEKGCPVIYVGTFEGKGKAKTATPAGTIESEKVTFLRYYTVFNTDQCEGLAAHLPAPVAIEAKAHDRILAAEAVVERYSDKPTIQTAQAAWYRPSVDLVGIPPLESFDSAEFYYATLLHELAHSTGAESRLNRDGITGEDHKFGSVTYGKEELIAELAACFLCADVGIDQVPASASYCQSWITVLKGDAKLIISAAAAAQKAYEYIAAPVVAVERESA